MQTLECKKKREEEVSDEMDTEEAGPRISVVPPLLSSISQGGEGGGGGGLPEKNINSSNHS